MLDSVVEALLKDPLKKFIYVESAFFFRWWDNQPEEMQMAVKVRRKERTGMVKTKKAVNFNSKLTLEGKQR